MNARAKACRTSQHTLTRWEAARAYVYPSLEGYKRLPDGFGEPELREEPVLPDDLADRSGERQSARRWHRTYDVEEHLVDADELGEDGDELIALIVREGSPVARLRKKTISRTLAHSSAVP